MIDLFGNEYEEAVGVEAELPNGKIVVHHEHEQFKLIQSETGYLFDVADDIKGATYKYGITNVRRDDIPVEEDSPEAEQIDEPKTELLN